MRCLPVVSRTNSSNAAFEFQQESSTAVGLSSSGADNFDFMREKRQITDEQRADANRLKAVFKARQQEAKAQGRSLTQEDVAVMCEWSGQSAFGQYVRGDVPLNLKTLMLLAKHLKFDPYEVSPSLAELIVRPPNAQSTLIRKLNTAIAMHRSNPALFEYLFGCTVSDAMEWLHHGFEGNERAISCIEQMPDIAETVSHSNVTETQQPYREERKYPLISSIIAGNWREECDNFQPGDADEWISSTRNAGCHGYWLLVTGKSMEPDFYDGERVLVQPEGFDLISGKPYIAKLLDSGETTFKQYVRDAGREYLQPANPAYPIIQITENVVIIGRVIDGTKRPSLF